MQKENNKIYLKVVIFGESNAGKTSLLYRISQNIFPSDYIPIIGVDFHQKTIIINDLTYQLQLWDTFGSTRYGCFNNNYFRGSNGVILAFDITDQQSFNYIQSYYEQTIQFIEKLNLHISILLVGCKSDNNNCRVVSYDQANELAKKLGLQYIETSALNNNNCNEMVDLIINLIIKNGINNQNIVNTQQIKQNQKIKKYYCF